MDTITRTAPKGTCDPSAAPFAEAQDRCSRCSRTASSVELLMLTCKVSLVERLEPRRVRRYIEQSVVCANCAARCHNRTGVREGDGFRTTPDEYVIFTTESLPPLHEAIVSEPTPATVFLVAA